MTTASTFTTASSTPHCSKNPEWYRQNLRQLIAAHLRRLQHATGLTLDQIARERLGWSRGNNFSQLTLPRYKNVLSPATALQMAAALELDDEETDEIVIVTMRANADRNCQMSPLFQARYDKALARRLCAVAKSRGIRLS